MISSLHTRTVSRLLRHRTSRLLVWLCLWSVAPEPSHAWAQSKVRVTASAYRVSEATSTVEVSLTRSEDLESVVTVDYETQDGSARAGQDFTPRNGSVVFAAGETTHRIAVVILNDAMREPLETFRLTLTRVSAPAALDAQASAVISIEDNDIGTQFEFEHYWADEHGGTVRVGITRGPDENAAATVDLALIKETATAGVDFELAPAQVQLQAGQRLQLVSIPILNDDLREPAETLRLVLRNPQHTVLGLRTGATISILDNDPGVGFENPRAWVQEDEGRIDLNVLRGNDGKLGAFSLRYRTSDLTARQGEDYLVEAGTLHFAAGEMSRPIRVEIARDAQIEADERFELLLEEPSDGMTPGTVSKVTVTIVDVAAMSPPRFENTRRSPHGGLEVELAGEIAARFRPQYRLFQLEESGDLKTWQRLPPIVSSNSSTNPVRATFEGSPTAFYRLIETPAFVPDPQPTGRYAVGVTRRYVEDPQRRNRYRNSAQAVFPVTLWYPAGRSVTTLPDSYIERELSVPVAAGVPGWMEKYPRLASHATRDQPIAKGEGRGPWPIILYSHGANGWRLNALPLAIELASHGYIVAVPDHYDAWPVPLANGRLHLEPPPIPISEESSTDRVRDLMAVLDSLQTLNSEDPLLQGGCDLTRVAAIGYSWGAYTAAEFGRVDDRCSAVVVLELTGADTGFPTLLFAGLQKPLIMLNAANNPSAILFNAATKDAYWVQLSNTGHSDFALTRAFTPHTSAPAREAMQTLHAYALSFLNKHLLGTDDHLLDDRSPAFPRVSAFRRK